MAKVITALVIAAVVLLTLIYFFGQTKPTLSAPSAPAPILTPIEYGSICGVVTDGANLEPIVGATVRLVGYHKGAICDTAGRFRVDSVPVGMHSIRAAALGYEITQIDSIRVSAGKITELAIQLVSCVNTLGTVIHCCSDSASLFLDSLNAIDSMPTGR